MCAGRAAAVAAAGKIRLAADGMFEVGGPHLPMWHASGGREGINRARPPMFRHIGGTMFDVQGS